MLDMTRRVVVQRPGLKALVAGGYCAPCVAQEQQAATMALQETYQNNAEVPSTDARWSGILAFEGVTTGDGRHINPGAARWESLPIPLRWAEEDHGAHKGAVVVGMIETIERRTDGALFATGFIDWGSENGQKAYNLMSKGMLKGVSVDMDEVDVELRVRKEIYDRVMSGDTPETPEAVDGYVKVDEGAADDEIMFFLDTLIRAATLCDIPAFKGAYLALDDASLVAAAPIRPPAAWFESPALSEATPITITDDGRVFGHVALWNTCHTGFANSCVTAPRSLTNYSLFRTGELVTDEGTHIPVGKITMSTGHASTRLSAAPAAAHYDDTGAVAADVSCGEDKHGIWISGALRPGLSDEQVRELRAAPMSGDWRQLNGNLEMVALLAVNLPGFPVPRTRALVASGQRMTLLSPVPGADSVRSSAMAMLNQALLKHKLAQWDREMK